jgi:mono/diheme cytochrome c family protein
MAQWGVMSAASAALIWALLAAGAEPPSNDDGVAVFRSQVRPLLTANCLTCHGADRKRGGLDLTRRAAARAGGKNGPAVVPGRPDESLLWQKTAAGAMPPQGALPPEQVAALRRWIEAGAPYEGEPLVPAVKRAGPDWWSLQPVRRPVPPPVRDARWVRTPVDAFVLAGLEEHGLRPAPEADRATLLRRLSFDLLGLPPAPEEVDAFVNDPAPDAYEHLVDRLLASPHYGERWARHWLDVVRFAESHGYETNNLRLNAWPYRDYAIRAFNEDTPYPRFILEQLAGDTLPDADWLVQSATGFLVGGGHDVVGNQTVEGQRQQRMDDLDDLIATTGATFLGLTVNCARCHDHKFDPIDQRDYYGLQAVFAGVQHGERPVRLADTDQRRRETAAVGAELDRLQRRLDDLEPLAGTPARSASKGIQARSASEGTQARSASEGTQARSASEGTQARSASEGTQARSASAGTPPRPAVQPRRNVDRFTSIEARFIRFTVRATNTQSEPCLDELEVFTAEETPRNVALASAGARATASGTYPNSPLHRLEHLNDGRYGNGRSWISNEAGKGYVQLEFPRVVTIDRVVWGRDRELKYADRLATDYRIEVAVEPGAWRLVASSADRLPYGAAGSVPEPPERAALLQRRAELEKRLPELEPVLSVYAGTFTPPGPTHLLTRGDPMRQGELVAPSALAVIRPPLAVDAAAPESVRRVALARWLGRPDNPLPARVLVNRVWHYHFGQGLVATPSDFGSNGDRPSHPDLLDYLAANLMDNGWRLKPLHRLMLLSSTYRQSGRLDVQAQAVDRQDRLLWRVPPRRLEAEAVRDAMLAVSGKLDRRPGGPGYNLWEKNTNYVVVFKPKVELGPEEFRRMIYQFKPRSQQDPTFGVFDCPDAALARPKRTVSTTVLQALNLLNSRFALDQAAFFAERLRREAGDDPDRQVRRAFRLAFGRVPTATERAAAVALVHDQGTAALCRALYNANEFLYVD